VFAAIEENSKKARVYLEKGRRLIIHSRVPAPIERHLENKNAFLSEAKRSGDVRLAE
jgi:hypothetical protein